MKYLLKILKKYSYGAFCGVCLGNAGYGVTRWETWFFLVVMIILVEWRAEK